MEVGALALRPQAPMLCASVCLLAPSQTLPVPHTSLTALEAGEADEEPGADLGKLP